MDPAYFASEMAGDIGNNDAFAPVIAEYCPLRRGGQKGELDGVLIYFASYTLSYTTGQQLTVDGGWTLI